MTERYPGLDARVAAFAATWDRTLPAGTSFVPGGRARRRALLEGFAQRLVAAIIDRDFDRGEGFRVGHDMVHADLAHPRVLLCSTQILREQLLAAVERPEARAAGRLTELLDELVHGFTTAMREQVAGVAESINRSERAAWRDRQRDLEAQVRHQLLHDPLTGLPNRAALGGLLAPMPPRLGLCVVNLRGFAAVNQLLGHDAGNALLLGVAQRLQVLAVDRGYHLGHLGGDTFVLVVPGTAGGDEAIKAADAALRVLPSPWPADGHDIPVAGRAGIVEGPACAGPDELLRQASMALDWARHDGAAWAMYDAGRATAHLRRHQRANALAEALAGGEITAAFQPIVRLADHAVVGMHALPRWVHPAGGPVPEAELLDIAERCGLLAPLGRHLLASACERAAAWQGHEPAPIVSIDVAAGQLRHPDFVDGVIDVLRRTGLPPAKLHVAVPERALHDETDAVAFALDGLDRLGVRVAVAQVGLGHANPTASPVHSVRIDPQLISGLARSSTTHRSNLSMATWLIAMFHDLAIAVTATGVDSRDQAAALRLLDCDYGLGRALGRPMTPDAADLLFGVPDATR
ncbi:bifunctional diguanylate cyclase/phosphodiesterase [Dactylosporangium sp. NPDC051485]|uniref:bifunctional diguanylate cyclase/phosphodiesterase n=1 Tax=Dactylosporangium sp. NPDC051485 TaxID=3154846 RepID=UPI00343F8766